MHADYQNMGIADVLSTKVQEASLTKHGSPLTLYGEHVVSDESSRYVSKIPGYLVLKEWVSFDNNFSFVLALSVMCDGYKIEYDI